MPAYYAHHRFGRAVAGQLSGDLKEIVRRHRPLFDIGLQGPDLFFFYRPYSKNRVNRYGSRLHHSSALPFFRNGVSLVRKSGRDSAQYAYLLGFLCHFILDSECHPYVEEMIEVTGVKHLEIEEEFEKLLLRLDGHNPFSYPLANRIPTDRATAGTVSEFYSRGITPKLARRTLLDLRAVKRLFTTPRRWKHDAINAVMKLSPKTYPYSKGLMNQRADNPACRETNRGLWLRFNASVALAVQMADRLDASVRLGEPLDARLNRTFE